MDLFGEEPEIFDDEEESVTAQEEEGPQTSRSSEYCLGHDDIENHLLELARSGRMPHGLIFAGQKGIGKATMAYRLARYLLKSGNDSPNQNDTPPATGLHVSPNDPVFRRVLSGGHPDFMCIERAFDTTKNRFKDNVTVDEIRKVPGFLRMTASEGGYRIVIIDDADAMNRNAQNALLKVLEEPPNKAILILVTHRLGALIPTIRSRTQAVNFQALNRDTLKDLLQRQHYQLSPSQIQTLAEFAEGSIGKAVKYLEEGGIDTYAQLLELLETYPKFSWPKIHQMASTLGRSGEEDRYFMFTHLFQWCFNKMAVTKARGLITSEGAALDHACFRTMLKNSSLEQRLKICENLNSHFDKVKAANLDKKQGILSAFSVLSEAA